MQYTCVRHPAAVTFVISILVRRVLGSPPIPLIDEWRVTDGNVRARAQPRVILVLCSSALEHVGCRVTSEPRRDRDREIASSTNTESSCIAYK